MKEAVTKVIDTLIDWLEKGLIIINSIFFLIKSVSFIKFSQFWIIPKYHPFTARRNVL